MALVRGSHWRLCNSMLADLLDIDGVLGLNIEKINETNAKPRKQILIK